MKTKIIAAATVLALLLCGCNADSIAEVQNNGAGVQQTIGTSVQNQQSAEQNEDEIQHYAIEEGIAMLCTNGIIFILSDCNGNYPELTPISMSAADGDSSIFNGLVTGDKIKIEIELIGETYPAVTWVYSLEKTGSGSKDDIPADLLARLEELGYTAVENAEAKDNAIPCAVTEIDEIEMYETGGVDGREYHWRVLNDKYGGNTLVFENMRMNEVKTYELSDDEYNEITGIDFSRYIGKKDDNEGIFDAVYYNVIIRYEDGTEALSEAYIPDLWRIFNYYLYECEPYSDTAEIKELFIPKVFEPAEGYPRFKRDAVSRITVIPEFQIPMGKKPLEVPERLRQDMAMLIEVYEAEQTEKPAEELTGGGYIVTVYDTKGNFIEYNFWNEEIFVVDGIYYRFAERAYGENIINDIVAVIREAEVNETFGETALAEITPLSEEEDIQIRTDYAAYVSSRYKVNDSGTSGTPLLLSADDVHGEFYFGTYDGYMLVVMCPTDCITDEIGVHRLRYTDADIIDPSCDCYPYIDIELSSGMFELLAYKDGTFITVEKALETKLIDYSVAKIISDHLIAYYQGNRTCAYNISSRR